MLTIELQQIKLHAFHGLYPGEERLGSPYEVSLKAQCMEPANGAYQELSDTVNYAQTNGGSHALTGNRSR